MTKLLPASIAIGEAVFVHLRRNNNFYGDETNVLTTLLGRSDIVTRITRPRRFGKTFNRTMVHAYLDRHQQNTVSFSDLCVWETDDIRAQHACVPVVFLSFRFFLQRWVVAHVQQSRDAGHASVYVHRFSMK
jgi:hypothetical protein